MNSKNLLKKSQIEFNEIHAKVSMILSSYISEKEHVLKQKNPKKISNQLNLKKNLKDWFENVYSMMAFIKNYLSNNIIIKNLLLQN